ncbi:MAG: YjbF family lipoprotein [Aestuariivita sp.]|uniref:YjbF family lipoprotein n=1 Tax=Aestuariivita sp. TaxID=1872407 RepID=UPI003BAEF38E
MSRLRSLCLVAVCLVFAACGTVTDDGSLFDQLVSRVQESQDEARFGALRTADAPVLQIAIQKREQSGSLLLERRDGPFEYWLSSDGVQIILEDGMVHGVRGLGDGLLASELSEPLARLRGLQEGPSDRFHSYLDGNDMVVTRTYRCAFREVRNIPIDVEGGQFDTVLFRESCNSLDQSFENLYWVDTITRQIVQSRQWIGPFTEALSTRIVLR